MMKLVKRRLRIFSGPDGKPLAFFPDDVVMVNSVSVPEKSGLKDDKGAEIPAKPVYRPDLTGILSVGIQQPIIVKGELKEVVEIINAALKWAEGESR